MFIVGFHFTDGLLCFVYKTLSATAKVHVGEEENERGRENRQNEHDVVCAHVLCEP